MNDITILLNTGFLIFLVDIILYVSKKRYQFLTESSVNRKDDTEILRYGFFDNELLPFYGILSLLLQIIVFFIGWSRYKYIYAF